MVSRELKSVIDWWESQGVDVPEVELPKPKPAEAPKAKDAKPKRKKTPSQDTESLAAEASTLPELKAILDRFDSGQLTAGARQAVFARGNPEADVMIIGEAPGRDEDVHGLPFVGRSGKLLDKMMGAIGLDETGFYVTNVVNWRPERNRTPNQDEIRLCQPFLFRHIELAKPKVLLLTGNVPLQALTGETGIMRQRGHWREVEVAGKPFDALPIYHPAFLLRQPALKKDAWRDLLSLRAKLDGLG